MPSAPERLFARCCRLVPGKLALILYGLICCVPCRMRRRLAKQAANAEEAPMEVAAFVVGPSGAGKTAIPKGFADGSFPTTSPCTPGQFRAVLRGSNARGREVQVDWREIGGSMSQYWIMSVQPDTNAIVAVLGPDITVAENTLVPFLTGLRSERGLAKLDVPVVFVARDEAALEAARAWPALTDCKHVRGVLVAEPGDIKRLIQELSSVAYIW